MDLQRCGTCREIKPIDAFNFRNKRTGKRHTTCRDCQRIYKRNFYLRRLEDYKKNSAQAHIASVERNRKLAREYLSACHCGDCGASDVDILEFDHTERDSKDRTITQLINNGLSWTNIMTEIAKCEVRCANCHRIRTAKQFGWYL
jgi:hypothetical protein